MFEQCSCVNAHHKPPPLRCTNTATKVCTTCNDLLCPFCAKAHHDHTTIVAVEAAAVAKPTRRKAKS